MTAMPPLRQIINDTPANAVHVDWNFQTIEDYVTTDLIHKDGSVAMEAPLNLLGPSPSLATHAVTKGYVDSIVTPVGTIWAFAGAVAPAGWALCDGAQKSTTDPAYAALFALIQYTYGGAGGTFNVPNLKGRVPVGLDTAAPISNNLGGAGGNRDASIPAHTHPIAAHTHAQTAHTHTAGAHQHYTDAVNHNAIGSVFGSRGNPSGWPGPGSPSGILFGDPPLSTGMGSRSPADWFMQVISVDVGSHWSRVGDGAVATDAGNSAAVSTQPNAATNTDQATGGVSAVNQNMQPYLTVNYIIRIG